MTTLKQVMAQLKKLGNEQTRRTFQRHGAPENMFGVKVADLKTIVKQIRGEPVSYTHMRLPTIYSV